MTALSKKVENLLEAPMDMNVVEFMKAVATYLYRSIQPPI